LVKSTINGSDARDRDEVVAKLMMIAKGGIMELIYLADLPKLAKDICNIHMKRVEALNRK
jgi:hypothetical protein